MQVLTYIQLNNQEDPLADLSSLVLGPVNFWPPCIPSSVLQLVEHSRIYLVSFPELYIEILFRR